MKQTNKIYIDIHSLLDIRQAILSKCMGINDLVTFINSDDYMFRSIDDFKNIDMNKYNDISKNLTIDLLQRSSVTYILTTLKNKISNLEKRNTFYNEDKVPEILLNIYPFSLDENQIEILRNTLFIKLKSECLITIINMPPKEVSPYFIKSSSIIVFYTYYYSEWLNLHLESMSQTKLLDTIIYFPSLYKVYDENEIKKIKATGFDSMFDYLEFILSNVAVVQFLPIIFYSNIVSASLLLEKYNDKLSKENLGDKYGDIGREIQVP